MVLQARLLAYLLLYVHLYYRLLPNCVCRHDSVYYTYHLPGVDDFQLVSTDLMFERCSNRSCTSITIQSDEIMEETETFTITLERTLNLNPRIRLSQVDGEVTILDVSSKWRKLYIFHKHYIIICLVCLGSPFFLSYFLHS